MEISKQPRLLPRLWIALHKPRARSHCWGQYPHKSLDIEKSSWNRVSFLLASSHSFRRWHGVSREKISWPVLLSCEHCVKPCWLDWPDKMNQPRHQCQWWGCLGANQLLSDWMRQFMSGIVNLVKKPLDGEVVGSSGQTIAITVQSGHVVPTQAY